MTNKLRIGAVLGAGVLVFSGCPRETRTPTDERAQTGEQEEMQNGAAEERAEALREADASQPGRVRAVMNGTLILEPYQEIVGDSRLSMPEDAPVFYRETRVSSQALRPGVDVRVHYRMPQPGEQPEVVAVEILDPQEAQQIQQQERQQPGQWDQGQQQPGTQQPGTQQPGTQQPGTQQPGTQQPGTQQPGTQQPGTQQPGTQQPGTQQPGTQQPGTQQPGTQQPGTQQPGTQQPGTPGEPDDDWR